MRMKLLIPSLRPLGAHSGFCLQSPESYAADRGKLAPKAASRAYSIQLEAFHGSKLKESRTLTANGSAPFFQYFEEGESSLLTAEYLADPENPPLTDLLKTSYEGQLIYRSGTEYMSVLTGFSPSRPKGSRYSPIFHKGHYFFHSGRVSTYLCFASYHPSPEDFPTIPENRFEIQVLSEEGALLGKFHWTLPFNTTGLLSLAEVFDRAGCRIQEGKHFSVIARGGASQFAIFTVFRNEETGRLSIEHSLPPLYYTEAIFKPESRALFQQKVFQGL